jgi:hypothetical protein
MLDHCLARNIEFLCTLSNSVNGIVIQKEVFPKKIITLEESAASKIFILKLSTIN